MCRLSAVVATFLSVSVGSLALAQVPPPPGGGVPCPDDCYEFISGESENCDQMVGESACDGDCSAATSNGAPCLTNLGVPDMFVRNLDSLSWPALKIAGLGDSGYQAETCDHVDCFEVSGCECEFNYFEGEYDCKPTYPMFVAIKLRINIDINSFCDGVGLIGGGGGGASPGEIE